jgi:hypothetical protein
MLLGAVASYLLDILLSHQSNALHMHIATQPSGWAPNDAAGDHAKQQAFPWVQEALCHSVALAFHPRLSSPFSVRHF